MTDKPTPQLPCPSCGGRRVVPSEIVMRFISRYGVAAWQVGHAILVLEEERWEKGGYDPALYAEAGFDSETVDAFQAAADAFQIHACPACAPHENAEGPCAQARDAMAVYSAKISAETEAEEVP